MNNFNLTHNRLRQMNFEEAKRNGYEGFSLYEKNEVNVLIKQFHTDKELVDINSSTTEIKMKLLEEQKNIYNSYLIILVDEKINYEEVVMIERNNIGLRKYIVRNENDLNRIPFLDEYTITGENNPEIFKEVQKSDEVSNVFKLLEEYDGKNRKIKTEKIEEIVEKLMQGIGVTYES